MKNTVAISSLILLGFLCAGNGGAGHAARSEGDPPALLTISPLEIGPFGCGEAVILTFHYVPAATSMPARGYEVHLSASKELMINSGGVTFFEVPAGADALFYVVEKGPGQLALSYAILGDSGQIDTAADLFTLEVHCVPPGGAGTVAIDSVRVRGLDNQPITVDAGPPATVVFKCPTAVETLLPFSLGANFPNPFNPVTTIRFALPEQQHVRLDVYGVDGRRVARLADAPYAPGAHEVTWHGTDDRGQVVAAGMYFYRIDAGPHQQVRKMVLVK